MTQRARGAAPSSTIGTRAGTLVRRWSGERDADRDESEPEVLDARLLPAALICWGVTIVVLNGGWRVGLVVAGCMATIAAGVWWVLWLGGTGRSPERWRGVAWVVLAVVSVGAGFAVAAAWREQRVAAHPLREAVGSSVGVRVVPSDDPKAVRGTGFGGSRRWVVRAELAEFRRGDRTVEVGGKVVILAGGAEWGRVLPGRAIEFRATVDPPRFRDLTVVTLRATGPPRAVGELPWWQAAAARIRTGLAGAAAGALSEDAAGLLPALVVGDTSALPDSVRADFETAGLQHLCVVSGANFTILLSVVLFVARLLTLGPRAGATVGAVALLLFIVVARPDPSVLRAGAMGAVTLLALITGRRKQALPALCAAVVGLVGFAPELAVSAGFALSVVATGGLILLAPSWADWLRDRGWWRLPAEIVAVSAGAFVVTVPIMVALTGRVSLVAVLANILVAPVVAPITVVGAIAAAIAWMWGPAAELILHLAAPPLWWLLSVAGKTAALPGASLTVPGGTVGGSIATALVLTLIWGLRTRRFRRLAAAALLGSAVVLVPLGIWRVHHLPPDRLLAPHPPPPELDCGSVAIDAERSPPTARTSANARWT